MNSNVSSTRHVSEHPTWEFLKEMRYSASIPVAYHLHIPKTGGTSIFGNLLKSTLWCPMNTDSASPESLASIRKRVEEGAKLKIYARSHNTVPTLKRMGVMHIPSVMFTVYRDPLEIQISNANMVGSRVNKYFSGALPKETNEGRWTEKWISTLGCTPSTDIRTVALAAIRSPAYREQYSDILCRYFGDVSSFERLASSLLLTISLPELSGFMEEVFQIKSVVRLNESDAPWVTADDLTRHEVELLCLRDNDLAAAMRARIIPLAKATDLFDKRISISRAE